MADTRFHEGSAYERGFAAGWVHRDTDPRPILPADIHGTRAIERWKRGLHDGIEAQRTKRSIDASKALAEVRFGQRASAKRAEAQRLAAERRFGPNHNR